VWYEYGLGYYKVNRRLFQQETGVFGKSAKNQNNVCDFFERLHGKLETTWEMLTKEWYFFCFLKT